MPPIDRPDDTGWKPYTGAVDPLTTDTTQSQDNQLNMRLFSRDMLNYLGRSYWRGVGNPFYSVAGSYLPDVTRPPPEEEQRGVPGAVGRFTQEMATPLNWYPPMIPYTAAGAVADEVAHQLDLPPVVGTGLNLLATGGAGIAKHLLTEEIPAAVKLATKFGSSTKLSEAGAVLQKEIAQWLQPKIAAGQNIPKAILDYFGRIIAETAPEDAASVALKGNSIELNALRKEIPNATDELAAAHIRQVPRDPDSWTKMSQDLKDALVPGAKDQAKIDKLVPIPPSGGWFSAHAGRAGAGAMIGHGLQALTGHRLPPYLAELGGALAASSVKPKVLRKIGPPIAATVATETSKAPEELPPPREWKPYDGPVEPLAPP